MTAQGGKALSEPCASARAIAQKQAKAKAQPLRKPSGAGVEYKGRPVQRIDQNHVRRLGADALHRKRLVSKPVLPDLRCGPCVEPLPAIPLREASDGGGFPPAKAAGTNQSLRPFRLEGQNKSRRQRL